jgi:hypothetical protein
MFRRADRPQGEPNMREKEIDAVVRRLTPTVKPGMVNVYSNPDAGKGTSLLVAVKDAVLDAEDLGEWQQRGYILWGA